MNLFDWRDIRLSEFALEEIARKSGVYIEKALDPLDPADFVTICVRLAASLKFAVKGTEGVAIRNAIDGLDVDWPTLSAAGRTKIITAARNEIAGLESTVPKLVAPVLEKSAVSLVTRTRVATVVECAFGTQLRDEAPVDRETVENLPRSQAVYIKDQYGRRADQLDQIAKDTVASGLERGLGRDDISEEVQDRLKDSGVVRTAPYWELIASDFANKGRTSTQLNTFERAGVSEYLFKAIMDQATSDICRLLDGRTFSVKKAAARMNKAIGLTDPDDVKSAMPWVQTGTDGNGKPFLYYYQGDRRIRVADIATSAVGEKDKVGSFENAMSNKQLEAAGLPVPPRHGHCRSTLAAML